MSALSRFVVFVFFVVASLVVEASACVCGVAPERENDFYWENDRVGFRAYGPGEYHKWSGIDLFIKNTPTNAVVHLLRKHGDYGNWHENRNPLAYDNFTMGAKRGVGAVAIFADGEWKTYPDWEKSKVIHEGDDYLEFELVYPAACALGKMTYHITMKKGDDFFRNHVTFERPERMQKDWLVGPGVYTDPNCEAKPFIRVLPADERQVKKTRDHLGCEVLGFSRADFVYEAGFRVQPSAPAVRDARLGAMVKFLDFLPQALTVCAGEPAMAYYGPGDHGHWAVQQNQQVAAALAYLSAVPAEDLKAAGAKMTPDELAELAVKLFRYSLHTHQTGDRNCEDGVKWGRTWISVLGLERSSGGLELIRARMTPDDLARLKQVLVYEGDYRLKEYPIKAGITNDNVPESNLWNAGVMFRTAADYPELKQGGDYLVKARKMMLNGLTTPKDAGAPWYVGPQFTENWALDHHGYMNVGYAYEALSNLAFLYFTLLEKEQPVPPELMHNVRELWQVCKLMTFPDGRLCRLGGDTRSRYTYCQIYALPVWSFVAKALGDEDALRYAREYLKKIVAEQNENSDGSFFGRRLKNIRDASWYYYCRLEADAALCVAADLHWHRRHQLPQVDGEVKIAAETAWQDDYERSLFIAGPKSYRSTTFRAQGGFAQRGQLPNIICAPTAKSDLAEWSANLVGMVGFQIENDGWGSTPDKWPKDAIRMKRYQDHGGEAFELSFTCPISDDRPFGEGEEAWPRGERKMKIFALGDGATMVIRDRVKMTRTMSLEHGFEPGHLVVPNDVMNGFKRDYRQGRNFVTVDNALTLIDAKGGAVSIRRGVPIEFELPRERRFMRPLRSLNSDHLHLGGVFEPLQVRPGQVLYDVVYVVTAGIDGAAAAKMAGSVRWDESAQTVTLGGADGIVRTLAFGAEGAKTSVETDPKAVSRLITEQFLRSDPLAYKPEGTDIAKHFPTGYGWGNSIFYATASLWVTAMDNARKFGEKELEARLTAKFRPFLAREGDILKPVYHVDYNVVGTVPLVYARLTGDAKARELGLKLADYQWSEPQKELKVINGNPLYPEALKLWQAGYSGETRLWIDDMYMINLLQTEAYRLTRERKYVDRAAKEMCLYLDKLQLENGLFYHAADVPFVWGRGAGWMAAGMPLVLKCLPADHPDRAKILAGYRRMMKSLLKYQRADGLWGQLVDDPTTWGETSGSAMFAYGFAEGVANGWLDRGEFLPALRKAWTALCGRLDRFGNLSDVCIGTNKKNDRQYYLDRGRINGDPHGQAPMLWLAGALQNLK